MKKKIYCFIGIMFLMGACGSGSEQPAETGLTKDLSTNPKIHNFITFDVLGGMFRATTTDIESMVSDTPLEEGEGVQSGKSNVNGPQSDGQDPSLQTPARESLTEPFTLDRSFHFVGYSGKGGLVLSVSGSAQKVYESLTAGEPRTYQFRPMEMTFRFFNYLFYNRCIGFVRLDGDIRCRIEGDYDRHYGSFLGNAVCQSNGESDFRPILYMTTEANYDIQLSARMTIDGNPFMYGSYEYNGDVLIDGEKEEISSLIGDGMSCSY